ncbi:response regulator transcription factor [Thiospirochaeta perfilievii]|uniref:Response regulator transcription factor n=1 Tax=Thiospirochaeta perfilievii TaxID=252967 RepID=A0A5C1QG84_9SPIO|nr:response regulator transcription factor [Thiospirochaeta perfilievii]QEN05546.1 response regulator transcription factor [Thiospirochaeta perfilievii]
MMKKTPEKIWLNFCNDYKDIEIKAQSATGDNALTHLEQRYFDLAFIDIGIPGKTGVEVVREAISRGIKLHILFLLRHFPIMGQKHSNLEL